MAEFYVEQETRIILELSVEEADFLRKAAGNGSSWGEFPEQGVYDALDDALVAAGLDSTYLGDDRPWRS